MAVGYVTPLSHTIRTTITNHRDILLGAKYSERNNLDFRHSDFVDLLYMYNQDTSS